MANFDERDSTKKFIHADFDQAEQQFQLAVE